MTGRDRAGLAGMAVVAAGLLLAGCGEGGSRDPVVTATNSIRRVTASDPQRGRVILVPPIAAGPLAAAYPEASVDFGGRVADRIDSNGASASVDGRFAETLPPANDPRWAAPTLPAVAKGADLVLLVTISDLVVSPGIIGKSGPMDQHTATVDAVLRNGDGSVRCTARAVATARTEDTVKAGGPANRQPARASREAIDQAVDRVLNFLAVAASQPVAGPMAQPVAPAPADGQVGISVDSAPSGADILVDGTFRGTTPSPLRLKPGVPVKLRIELAGHLAWEREFTPEPGMRIAPALPAK